MFYIANVKCKKCLDRNNKFKSSVGKIDIVKFINSKKFKLIINCYLKCLKKYKLMNYLNLVKKIKIIKKNINTKNPLFKFLDKIKC